MEGRGLTKQLKWNYSSVDKVDTRSSDLLIILEKGECGFCHLKEQVFIEFLHPAIVLHIEWSLEGDLTSAQVYPVPWLCLLNQLWAVSTRCKLHVQLACHVVLEMVLWCMSCISYVKLTHGPGTNMCPGDKKVKETLTAFKELTTQTGN